MRLTKNFTLAEFTVSGVAARRGLDNSVPPLHMENVKDLAHVMQQIRDFLSVPVVINSGYRSPEVNRLVGGSPTSHHRYAAAADWIAPGFGSPLECAKAIAPHMEQWGITQLIHEFGGWVHLGILPVKPVNKIITIDRHGTRTGLHPAR